MSARDELVLDAVAGRRVSSSGWVRGNCPFCAARVGSEDRKACLGFDTTNGKWHCFRCQARGLVMDFEAFESHVARPRPKPEEKGPIELPEGFFALYDEPGMASWAADGARDYLARRGVGVRLGRSAGIGAVLTGRYRGRIVVPVFAADGRALLGWSARLFIEPAADERPPPKYLYPAGMNRQTLLYNAAALRERTTDPVFVVEGVFDALPLWPDAVACLGQPSSGQYDALASAERPIVCLLDGDAWRKSEGLFLKLRVDGRRVVWHRLPPRTDPGATDPATIRDAVAQALREVA